MRASGRPGERPERLVRSGKRSDLPVIALHTFATGATLRTMSTDSDVWWGPVVVLNDAGVERIGYYDNDEWVDDSLATSGQSMAVVSYSEPPFMFGGGFHLVPKDLLRPVNTDSLFRRRDALSQELYRAANQVAEQEGGESELEEPYDLLLEWAFVNSLLASRMVEAREHEGAEGGKRVFISHSSKDKPLAISISVDIANQGHAPWLDEWQIAAGESIPVKISEGLENSDYVLVLMSKASMESGWVEAEWMTKYWDEVRDRKVRVIPVMLEDCGIPTLLRGKKYADFRSDYSHGLEEVLRAVR